MSWIKVLGIDPGPPRKTEKAAGVSWVLVEMSPGISWAQFVGSGSVDPTLLSCESLALRFRAVDVVAIEYASGAVYEPFRAPPLLEQNVVAGALAMAFSISARSASLLRSTPPQWRKALTGKASVGKRKDGLTFDALIAQALTVNVRGIFGSFNEHHRDACGLAVVAGRAYQRGLIRRDGFMASL